MPGGSGGTFDGEKNSLTRYPNPPKFAPQFTARRLFIGPFGTGRELKKSFKLSLKSPPYTSGASVECTLGFTLMGFSVRNCLRLDQKPSVMTRSGVWKLGIAEAGPGTDGCAFVFGAPGLLGFGGQRLIKLLGTCSPNSHIP